MEMLTVINGDRICNKWKDRHNRICLHVVQVIKSLKCRFSLSCSARWTSGDPGGNHADPSVNKSNAAYFEYGVINMRQQGGISRHKVHCLELAENSSHAGSDMSTSDTLISAALC